MFADDTNISTNGKTNDELQERINVDYGFNVWDDLTVLDVKVV
jgi:hypothetical protein